MAVMELLYILIYHVNCNKSNYFCMCMHGQPLSHCVSVITFDLLAIYIAIVIYINIIFNIAVYNTVQSHFLFSTFETVTIKW